MIYQNCDGYHNENIAADNLELKFHMFSTLSSKVTNNESCDLICIKSSKYLCNVQIRVKRLPFSNFEEYKKVSDHCKIYVWIANYNVDAQKYWQCNQEYLS